MGLISELERYHVFKDDADGDLLSLNTRTESFGLLAENDEDDPVTFGIIDKIMNIFE